MGERGRWGRIGAARTRLRQSVTALHGGGDLAAEEVHDLTDCPRTGAVEEDRPVGCGRLRKQAGGRGMRVVLQGSEKAARACAAENAPVSRSVRSSVLPSTATRRG